MNTIFSVVVRSADYECVYDFFLERKEAARETRRYNKSHTYSRAYIRQASYGNLLDKLVAGI